MVKRVCRSSTALMLMFALLFTTFASLFIFTNEDTQGAAKSSGLAYVVEQDRASGGLAYGLGNVYGFKYKATPVKSSSANGYYQSNWMFCVQPSKKGWSNNSKLYDNNSFKLYETISRKTDVETMYKAIYYSIAGPGWDIKDSKGNYTWRKKIDDIISNRKASLTQYKNGGTCRYDDRDDIYYTVTHLVVSYIYANKNFSNDGQLSQMTQAWRYVISDLTEAYAKQSSVKNKMSLYIANYNNGQSLEQQSMVIATFSRRLRVTKKSSDERFTKGQGVDSNNTGAIKSKSSSNWNTQLPAYTYKGAQFAIFNDEAKAKKAAAGTNEAQRQAGMSSRELLTVKSNGKTDDYLIGISDTNKNYYAVEVKAPSANYAAPSNKYYKFEKTNEYSSIDGLPVWSVTVANVPRTANLKITKTSANTDITQNNSNYSLAGAQFAIFTSKTDADKAVKGKDKKTRTKNSLSISITTDSKGVGVFQDSKGKTVNLPILASSQAYYAVEYTAPKGYELYNSVITFKKGSLSGNVYQYTATIKENPKSDPIGVIAKKRNAIANSYDASKLAGAVFEVKYYDVDPTVVKTLSALEKTGKSYTRKWYFKTDNNGEIWYDSAHLVNDSTHKSSAMYFNSEDNPRIPLGAITIKEVAAPTSGEYQINNTTYFSTVTGTESDVKVDMNITIPENPSTTMISVLKESDDGLVANIYFRVTSSDGKVNEIIKTDESGSTYLDGLDVYTSDGKTKIVYTTSELGLMTSGSDADRQKAKYKIPGRYKKPADQTTTLTPNKPSQIVFVNEIETGSLNIIKNADDNSDSHNTIANVAFKITNGSDSTKVYTVLTDSNGNASLGNLPIYDDNGSVVKYKVTELGVASTVQRGYIYGDVDFNGVINADDGLYVSKYAVGLINLDATQLKVADVNGDGKVTAEDSVCIRSYNIGITDTDEIGKTGTVCSELGEGQFTEYNIPKRYEKQADQTISLTANKTLTVTFNNKTLKGKVTVVKDSYDDIVSNLWFNLTSGEGTDEYLATDSKGYTTFYDLPVYNDDDEKITYTVTELGFKQANGTYIFPAYYVEQGHKTVTLDEATDSNGDLIYSGVTEFYNRTYDVDLIILKNFTPITETAVFAKFRLKSVTDSYSFDNTYTTEMRNFLGDGSRRNGFRIHNLQPFLADGTPIVYEISEIEIVDSNGTKLPETYMSLLDSAKVSWSKDDFNDETNTFEKDEDEIKLVDTYVVNNYYSTGHLNIYKTADDNDVSDIWFKVECSDSIVKTQYVKTDKTGRAELDKIVSGTVKGGQLTYTVTELGKMTSGSEDVPEKATFEIPSKYEKPQPKTFSFDAGEIEPERTLAFSNKLYGSFRIHKVDENGKGVAGAKFQLLNTKGNVVGTCTTDSTGYSNTITRLSQGVYTVKEISTPKGFYLLRGESTVYIGNATVNERYPWIGNDFVEGTQYFYGDVNMDGTVDAEDAVLIQEYIVNAATLTDMQKKVADVTKDGEITTDDVLEINRYVSQLRVTELDYVYNVVETEQPPFPPAGGMNLFGVIIASSLFLVSLGSLMIVRRKAGK